ncbi:MAG: maltose acetyltransferase domain-containing protein, partial [Acetobacteraceae bacterium]
MTGSELERMLAGALYDASASEIQAEMLATQRWLARYNASPTLSAGERLGLLRERVADAGEGTVVRSPFHCDYGFNIRLGRGV